MKEQMTPCTDGTKTILVIDDAESMARAIARLLRRDGYAVETVVNGRLGLEKLLAHPYDLVLCDLRMPELDGSGLYRALKRCLPSLCRRMVFLTGDTLDQEATAFLAQAALPCLIKPFSVKELRHVIAYTMV